MSGIYHEWNGTTLTITSDSGTSSADLKGDMGVRGAQGVAGISNVDEVLKALNPRAYREPIVIEETKVGGYWSRLDTWVDYPSGAMVSKRTNLVPVYDGVKFAYQGEGYITWYNADKEFIGSSNYNMYTLAKGELLVEPMEGAAYVRFNSIAYSTDESKVVLEVHYLDTGDDRKLEVETKQGGIWSGENVWYEGTGQWAKRTNPILVNDGDVFHYTGRGQWSVRSVVWYGADGNILFAETHHDNDNPTTVILYPPKEAVIARFYSFGYSEATTILNVSYETRDMLVEQLKSANYLWGKKYVACGDSFTAGDFATKDDETWDSDTSQYKTYCWHIANRNNMQLINEAKSGSTMYNNGATNAFSVTRYTQIPTDADYITICFGLNETNATIGTLQDTTNETVMGAWNIVLEYLITNMPYAKIGIIIPDAWISAALREAMIDIAEYWGIPYLDLSGDVKVPLLIGGKRGGAAISSKARELRTAAFAISAEDNHPNPKGHAYRSTIIENFMRSL